MARIRTIKPEFFTSADTMPLSPLARLLYVGLWCEADRDGRFAWRPAAFKVRYLPSDACDIDTVCAELLNASLVLLYSDALACIPTFAKHQHINPREVPSVLPPPDPPPDATRHSRVSDATVTRESTTRHSRVSDASVTRREEGRKEGMCVRVTDASDTPPPSAPPAPARAAGVETPASPVARLVTRHNRDSPFAWRVDVPPSLHEQFVRHLGGNPPDAERALHAFYQAVARRIGDGPIPEGDDFVFWRREFKAWRARAKPSAATLSVAWTCPTCRVIHEGTREQKTAGWCPGGAVSA